MAATETLRTTLLTNGTVRNVVYTGANGAIELNTVINTGVTDGPQLISFGYATVQLVYIVSDQDVRLCVNAIHSGSPLVTINLKAGVPYIWAADGYVTNPFGTTNVAEFYWTNASGTNANIVGEILY